MPIVIPVQPDAGVLSAGLGGSFGSLIWGPGYKFHLGGITGLDDLPGVRAYDALRAGDHGGWAGTDLLAPRTVELTLHIIGDTYLEYAGLVAQLQAALQPRSAETNLYLYGSTRLIKARPRHLSMPYEADHFARTGTAVCQFVANDPRVYDAAQQAPTTTLPTAGGGFGFPFGFLLGFGAAQTGGNLTVTNSGNFPTRPVLAIRGPAINPSVANVTAGQSLAFTITLASTDTLTIDTDARSVLLNGTASRRNTLNAGSQWWELAPGDSALQFRGGNDPSALLIVTFRSAWLGKGGTV